MKRILLALALGAGVLTTAVTPVLAATTPAEEAILLKKKKALAAKRAAEKALKEAEADAAKLKKQKAAKQASASTPSNSIFAKRKPRTLRVEPVADRRIVRKKDCGGFMDCMFGKRNVRVTRNAGFQTASFSTGAGLSAKKTRKTIDWTETKYKPGTVVVRTSERALYYVLGDGEAIRYSVGVGKEGMQWSGVNKVSRKQEWPSWTPPQTMIEREAAKGHYIPDFMEGGPGNPLGARAMYLGGTMFRIHGTNNEASIGGAVSSGCIRMMNADVIDLYERVKIGATVYVY